MFLTFSALLVANPKNCFNLHGDEFRHGLLNSENRTKIESQTSLKKYMGVCFCVFVCVSVHLLN